MEPGFWRAVDTVSAPLFQEDWLPCRSLWTSCFSQSCSCGETKELQHLAGKETLPVPVTFWRLAPAFQSIRNATVFFTLAFIMTDFWEVTVIFNPDIWERLGFQEMRKEEMWTADRKLKTVCAAMVLDWRIQFEDGWWPNVQIIHAQNLNTIDCELLEMTFFFFNKKYIGWSP